MARWHSNVGLYDTDTGNQIGECWIVEAEAATEAEARAAIRQLAWDSIDGRMDDVRIELVDGPTPYADGAEPEDSLWLNDAIQFPRLLAEIMGSVEFTAKQRQALQAEMDLSWDQVLDLFERAQTAWEQIKANGPATPNQTLLNTLGAARAVISEGTHEDRRYRAEVLKQLEQAIVDAGGTVED